MFDIRLQKWYIEVQGIIFVGVLCDASVIYRMTAVRRSAHTFG